MDDILVPYQADFSEFVHIGYVLAEIGYFNVHACFYACLIGHPF